MLAFAELCVPGLSQLGDLCGAFLVDGNWGRRDGRFEGEECFV